ncbi:MULTISPECIES: hypothetical protein [Trichocoleus]|uniref:Tyr recombinase domain-containing protein n=1 Tax=Trichocoleus desertorum GB2-A4 TaxID=2933944 RepID=A0ABV0JGB2_9CYAN|nr:hypothetical protein [Trichocoleus sp. FACHB-46]MBD1865264.1 hypothetical protein [Trichocoleus sp. FACHB-46]
MLSQIPLDVFLNAEPLKLLSEACQAALAAKQIRADVERTTYRPAVNKFLKWIQQETWYEEAAEGRYGKYAPRTRSGTNIKTANEGRRALHANSYGLKESELTSNLLKQLEQLNTFCTGEYVPKRQDKKMRAITFRNHRGRALDILGWLRSVENYELNDLDLHLVTDLNLFNKFLAWGINERGNTCGWGMGFCDLALNIAKWLHCYESKSPMYRDIATVEEIRMINNNLSKRYEEQKQASKKRKQEEKEMTLEQCIEVIKYLRKCCAPRDSLGTKRSDLSVARSWQRYLLVAILTYCALRQREIRELELDRTLFRTAGGYRMVLHPEDNKTGDERDFMLSDVLAVEVVTDLDEWLNVWKPRTQAVTADLDSWLGFVGRAQYKDTKGLNKYLAKLEKKYQQAIQAGRYEEAEKVEKEMESAQNNIQTLKQARIECQHNLVFASFGTNRLEGYGRPMKASDLFNAVTRAVYTASAALKMLEHPLFKDIEPRKTNPHFFRNIAITHERRHGDPSKRKAFHKVLGNSEAIGDKDYNEMHPSEKTVGAKEWWKSDTLEGQAAVMAKVKALTSKLPVEERKKLLLELL